MRLIFFTLCLVGYGVHGLWVTTPPSRTCMANFPCYEDFHCGEMGKCEPCVLHSSSIPCRFPGTCNCPRIPDITTPEIPTSFAPDIEFCFLNKADYGKRSLLNPPITIRIAECKGLETCRTTDAVEKLFPSQSLGMKLG